MTVTPDENGRINIADVLHLHKDAIVAMLAPANLNEVATKSGIKLQDSRVKVLLPVNGVPGEKMANYTISFTVQREPVTEGESVACTLKGESTEQRRKAKEDAIVTERQNAINMANANAEQRIRDLREMALAGNQQTANAILAAVASTK